VRRGWVPLVFALTRKNHMVHFLHDGRILVYGIARVIFTVEDGVMVLLHGFVKKSQKTPISDLKTARQRLGNLREE